MTHRLTHKELKQEIRKAHPKLKAKEADVLAGRMVKDGLELPDLDTLMEQVKAEIRAYWAQDFDKVRTDRGIHKDIWEARPYMRWPDSLTRDVSEYYLPDISPIRGAYCGLNKSQRGFMSRLANQSPGWVMMRYAVPGAKFAYAEIRPDEPVETGPPIHHWHAPEEPEGADEPGVGVLDYGSIAWEEHCRKVNERNAENAPWEPPHEEVFWVHYHDDEAKYVFAPSERIPEEWGHHHHRKRSGEYYKKHPEALEAHIENYHDEKHRDDIMWLTSDREHKHIRRVKDTENNLARRIDIHPFAMELLEEARVVFFVIEGVLKADAVLSAIYDESWNASVFNVPSVSLWNAPELDAFAERYLQGKTVIIIPDADWSKNKAVIRQARRCEFYLRERCRGIDAYVAAPPLKDGKVEHKGIDDAHAAGVKLADLTVLQRTESKNIYSLKRKVEALGFRSDRAENDMQAVRALAHQAKLQENREGLIQSTLTALAETTGLSRTSVRNILYRLHDMGELRVEGSFATRKGYHTTDGFYPSTKEWRKAKFPDGERYKGGKKKGQIKPENPRIYIPERYMGEDEPKTLDELLVSKGIEYRNVSYGRTSR